MCCGRALFLLQTSCACSLSAAAEEESPPNDHALRPWGAYSQKNGLMQLMPGLATRLNCSSQQQYITVLFLGHAWGDLKRLSHRLSREVQVVLTPPSNVAGRQLPLASSSWLL